MREDKNHAPLRDAIEKGDIEKIERLLNDGVHTEVKNKYGGTPLYVAVQ